MPTTHMPRPVRSNIRRLMSPKPLYVSDDLDGVIKDLPEHCDDSLSLAFACSEDFTPEHLRYLANLLEASEYETVDIDGGDFVFWREENEEEIAARIKKHKEILEALEREALELLGWRPTGNYHDQ